MLAEVALPTGFVLQPTYRIESDRPVVLLYGKLRGGESFLVRDDRQRPRFWVRESDAAAARREGAAIHREEPPRRTMAGEPVVSVEVGKPGDVPPLRDRLASFGVPTYEADVRFAYRYLVDRGVRGSVRIEGEARPGSGVDRVFENPDVRPADWTPELTCLSVDLETDPRGRRILSIALFGRDTSEVLLVAPEGEPAPPGATACATERDLLRAFLRRVREIDPDVLTGWNFVDFDLAVLARVAARLAVPAVLGRGPEPLRLRPTNAPGSRLEANVPGRLVLDGIQLLRGAFVRFDSYTLDFVARDVLGEGKTIPGTDRAGEIMDAFRNDRARLVEYNLTDARLALEIVEKLHLVELSVERSRLTGMPPNRVAASIASFDFLYLSELGRRRIVAPTVAGSSRSMPQTGGHVLEPETGLHENVLVLDFKSLYPSVIRTFQIDPLGRVAHDDDTVEDPIVAPNEARFRREPGILPGLLDDLFPLREAAKAAGDGVKSQAIKILMNSFYGVLGTPACRFASPELANAITGFGREILLWSRDRLEAKGYPVLYGDTDSLFVKSGAGDPVAARALGEELVVELNAELAEHVRESWGVEGRLELEFDKLYRKLFLPPMRAGGGGARKRYAGLAEGEGEPELVFTGMEVVRRDWTELAKRVQRGLYRRLFANEPVGDYLRDVVAEVRAGERDDELVYRKGLRKRLGSYTASTPPHVAAARKMSRRPGPIIEYVVTEDGPEPADERKAPLDREHYVQKQVRAVAEPVLRLLDLDFAAVVGDDRQLDLFESNDPATGAG